ncbi:MAG: cytochrome-c oxidase, cbb3-type subunit III [Alphaproteobacteria bacterium]|nr:cytochrome-c oxidase, cbb3-type subunit III [Alphaproteobacteria bacterium]
MPTKIEKDAVTGQNTTGHEWDGIKELNTPLPTWWVYLLYATIAWSIGLFVIYPSFPGITGYLPGVVGYSARQELADKMKVEKEVRAPFLDRVRNGSLEDIRRTPDLLGYAVAGGRVAFAENCAGCHQSGGAGAKGYPSLADDEWLWGGKLADIQKTIQVGIRSMHPDTRTSLMPRFGTDGILDRRQLDDVTEFVLSLSTKPVDPAAVERGRRLYAENCASCHGEQGAGMREFGAPSLTDKVWLFGGDKPSILRSIAEGRAGVMPAWGERLDPAIVKMLTLYVHTLGGGE